MNGLGSKEVDKLMEMAADVGEIKTHVLWLKGSAENTGRILEMHDKRLSKVEQDIGIIMERRTIFFKIARSLLGIFGWKI